MKNKIQILFITIIFFSYPAQAYEFGQGWTRQNTIAQATFLALGVVDWGQTLYIAKHPEEYGESNPVLGDHPSTKAVNLYMPIAMAAHTLIAVALPPVYREIWQYVWIGIEIGCVEHNANAGVRIEF